MAGMFDLSGRCAIVTGGNTGLGQGMALALARAGADIAVVSRRPADETSTKVQSLGRRCVTIQADLSSTEPVERVVRETVDALGDVDILVNNAGIIRRADSLEHSEEDWDAVLDTNLKSVFFLSQAFARTCVDAGHGGKIINVASMLSFQGGIRVAAYTASKHGVLGVTRILANDWTPKGINVNAIAPGYMKTDNTRALQEDKDRNAAIVARIPAGRWGEPSDMAGAAVFLASAASDYVTGSVLPVDGGWLSR